MFIPEQILAAGALVVLLAVLSKFKRLFHAVFFASLLISVGYFYWRINYTLNTVDWIGFSLSLILLSAELYSFLVQELLLYYTTARPTANKAPHIAPSELPTVDIYLPIYNEPIDVLRKTAAGCKALNYPADKLSIYILDDGIREDVRALARSTGCIHIATFDNKDGKAGKINNGLKQTSGDLVAFFDCDHIPVSSFLMETVGFFTESKVAFVQTAQHFYNDNVLERNLGLSPGKIRDGEFFHHVVQPGRDRYNSAFFTGTGAIFRRSVLEEVGGLRTETLVEDLHTSITIHQRGYRSVFLNKSLSTGLAPEGFADFLKQRRRWTKGSIQVLVLDNPLFKGGLSLHQRLNYFALFIDHFQGIPIIVYLCAPLTGLLFGYPPIVTDPQSFVIFFMTRLIIQKINLTMLYKGYMNAFWGRVYGGIVSFTLTLAALAAIIKPRGHIFEVTPKGQIYDSKSFNLYLIRPQILIFGLHLVAVALGLYYLNLTLDFLILVNLIWASYNMLILLAVVASTIEDPEKRRFVRLKRTLTCKLSFGETVIIAETINLSEGGLLINLAHPVSLPGHPLTLEIFAPGGSVLKLAGIPVNRKEHLKTVGISLINLTDHDYQKLVQLLYSPLADWYAPEKAIQQTNATNRSKFSFEK